MKSNITIWSFTFAKKKLLEEFEQQKNKLKNFLQVFDRDHKLFFSGLLFALIEIDES